MTASINRLSCDKYTGANITEPLLPMERGGLSFIKTWGRTSLDEWHQWAKNTQPDNEGDVLIQALLQLPLDFTQHLCSRYSRIAAISEAFKIVNSNVLEAEQRKQLQAIRAHLDRLEDGGAQVIDV